MNDASVLIKGATVLQPAGAATCDVRFEAGRIADVSAGADSSCSAQRVEAGGRLLVPAFHDAHVHLVFAGLLLDRPALGEARSRREALAMIASALAGRPDTGALVAEGWDETRWPDGTLDGRALDTLGASRPIVARRACGHVAAANTHALACIPPGNDVDAARGVLLHDAAMAVDACLPGLEAEREKALARAVRRARATGVVAVDEPCSLNDLEELRAAAAKGRLGLRVRAFLRYEDWTALPPDERRRVLERDGSVPVVGLKLFADGTIGSRSAALSEPYAGGGRGSLLMDARALASAASEAHAASLPIAVHAIGDRAVGAVLDALETTGVVGDRIEHAEIVVARDVERMARLGVTASMQPNFVVRWGGEGGLYEERLGSARARATNRFATLRRAGVALCFGSDSMPIGPLSGLGGALSHPSPDERLDPVTALGAYACGGAGAYLRIGAPADACLLSVCDPLDLSASEVVATWMDGRLVHPTDGAIA